MSLKIWCNTKFSDAAIERLINGVRPHRVIFSTNANASVLVPGETDPALTEADIAFGQPAVDDCIASPKLRWIALSTAGYTRYDHEHFKEILRQRGTPLT
ncbi:MAG TPA: D-2-hydroxyacid dehydrogenase, partial [Opitutus sp.]|nr:D-2-hydroxyacid dehydrogenase [Opitutus sp.]